ncbi:ATP-binding protein [Paenibacillus ginsengarvi]|uniref:ATP-binding protein n=1 Tax=Paenibacillus ginsengarvi TaxID=400777 RepID=A0A3B0BUC1_9BACL|nr:AAA family ATPase [Paenibacillus ginsengarvi]RKN75978.1 ATP-binding protein [Paenibacillus ginsengarvi]
MRDKKLPAADPAAPAAEAYAKVWDYYADELRLLDGKLRLLYARRQLAAADPQTDAFRGMYVSEDEFMRMVGAAEEEPIPQLAEEEDDVRRLRFGIAARLAASVKRGVFLPIVHLSGVFGLSQVERDLILLALAVELDRKYERIFGYLLDDLTVRLPNVGLALQLVCDSAEDMRAARLAFAPEAKLSRYFLSREETVPFGRSLLSMPIALDRRMTAFLLDTGELDRELRQVASIHYPDEAPEPLIVQQDVQQQLAGYIAELAKARRPGEAPAAVHLHGPAGAGKKLQLRHLCATWGKNLLIADLRAITPDRERFAPLLGQVLREAIMHQAALAFAHAESLFVEEPDAEAAERVRVFRSELDRHGLPLFLLSDRDIRLEWPSGGIVWMERELAVPNEAERATLWREFGRLVGLGDVVEHGPIAAQFRFTPGQIRSAAGDAAKLFAWRGKKLQDVLGEACYRQIRHKLERKAVRIEPKYGWDDIVLPSEQKQLLRNACNQVKYRSVVFGEWGFGRKLAYGKGLSMLFAGPPGTGKTMSAQVVAKDLRMELYKIDLSQVISKYIGETEKNLHEIFEEGKKSGAILFFDETDALFGKRSEVKDAHDKYANIETAYLLQKMEEYDGISVLATNLLNNIDEAFLRRIQFVIKFPFPDAEYREQIWRAMFPPEVPLDGAVDFKYIAQKIEIAGGNIKNVALSAAFLAAEQQQRVGMAHIMSAVRHELQKSGKIVARNELEDY